MFPCFANWNGVLGAQVQTLNSVSSPWTSQKRRMSSRWDEPRVAFPRPTPCCLSINRFAHDRIPNRIPRFAAACEHHQISCPCLQRGSTVGILDIEASGRSGRQCLRIVSQAFDLRNEADLPITCPTNDRLLTFAGISHIREFSSGHRFHGTGSSSKIFWTTVSLVFSSASAS